MHRVSRDLSLGEAIELAEGGGATALELQFGLLDLALRWAEHGDLDVIGGESVAREVLSGWQEVLEALERDPMELADRLDWVAKYRLFGGYRDRHGLEWNDPRLAAMDLQYHDLRPASSLGRRLGLRRLTTDEEVERATSEPPSGTRAYFRGGCLARFSEDIVAANWDSIVFDTGDSSLQRVPMLEPGRGTEAHVGDLLREATSTADLLARLRR